MAQRAGLVRSDSSAPDGQMHIYRAGSRSQSTDAILSDELYRQPGAATEQTFSQRASARPEALL